MPRTRMLTSTRVGRTAVQVQKWPKRLPNINLTGQRKHRVSEQKKKYRPVYHNIPWAILGFLNIPHSSLSKCTKMQIFLKTIFKVMQQFVYYCAMHYRQHRLEKKPQMNWKYTATFFFEVELGTINQVRKYCCPKFCWIQMTAWQIELCTKKNKSYE